MMTMNERKKAGKKIIPTSLLLPEVAIAKP